MTDRRPLQLLSGINKQNLKEDKILMGSCCLIFKHQSNTFTVFSEYYGDRSLSLHLFCHKKKRINVKKKYKTHVIKMVSVVG